MFASGMLPTHAPCLQPVPISLAQDEDAELDQQLCALLETIPGWPGGTAGFEPGQIQQQYQLQLDVQCGQQAQLGAAVGSATVTNACAGAQAGYLLQQLLNSTVDASAVTSTEQHQITGVLQQQQHERSLLQPQQVQLNQDQQQQQQQMLHRQQTLQQAQLLQQHQHQHQQLLQLQQAHAGLSWPTVAAPELGHGWSAVADPSAALAPAALASTPSVLTCFPAGVQQDVATAGFAGMLQTLVPEQHQLPLANTPQQEQQLLGMSMQVSPAVADTQTASLNLSAGTFVKTEHTSAPVVFPQHEQKQQHVVIAADAPTATTAAAATENSSQQHGRGVKAHTVNKRKRSKAAATTDTAADAAAAAAATPAAAMAAMHAAGSSLTAVSTDATAAVAAAAASILPVPQGDTASAAKQRRSSARSAGGSSEGSRARRSRQNRHAAAAVKPPWQLQWAPGVSSCGAHKVDDDASLAQQREEETELAGDNSEVDETGMSLQEKNRTAQRRFRQRQKDKMSSLEADVIRLSSALKAAGAEHRHLRQLNTALEKALALRDEHISGLQQTLRIFTPQSIGGSSTATYTRAGTTAAAGAAGAAASSEPPGVASTALKSSKGEDTAAATAATAATATEKQQQEHGVGLGAAGGDADLLQVVLGASGAPEAQPLTAANSGYTAEVVAAISPSDVMSEYASLVTRVRQGLELMQQADAAPGVHQSVDVTLHQVVRALCELVASCTPAALRQLLVTNAQTQARAEVDIPHWRSMVASLSLSERQVSDLLAARRRHKSDMAGLLQARTRVRDLLTASVSAGHATHIDVLSASLSAQDAHEALAQGLQAEHQGHITLITHMLRQVMSPLQAARAVVAAWPYFPNPLAITDVLQQQQQQHATTDADPAGQC